MNNILARFIFALTGLVIAHNLYAGNPWDPRHEDKEVVGQDEAQKQLEEIE